MTPDLVHVEIERDPGPAAAGDDDVAWFRVPGQQRRDAAPVRSLIGLGERSADAGHHERRGDCGERDRSNAAPKPRRHGSDHGGSLDDSHGNQDEEWADAVDCVAQR